MHALMMIDIKSDLSKLKFRKITRELHINNEYFLCIKLYESVIICILTLPYLHKSIKVKKVKYTGGGNYTKITSIKVNGT